MAEETIISKQEKGYQEEEEVPSTWSQLLPELLSRIALLAFRGGDVGVLAVIPCVCKSWNFSFDVNHTTTLIRKSLRDPPPNALSPDYPCLIVKKKSLCTFYHPNHTFTLDFPELSGFYIKFSKFGWLLLSSFFYNLDNESYTYFFFNPFTRQKVDLPACRYTFYNMCFSSPPTSPDCFVIGMSSDSERLHIIRRGEQKWVLSENEVLDLKTKTSKFLGKIALLDDSGTHPLAVMVPDEEQNIYMKMMTPSKQEWLQVKTLKNKMLFISRTSSILKPAPVKAASNKIYFPKILNEDSFVPYCLATKKYISFLGDYAPGNVTQQTNFTWIESMPFVPACNQQIHW